MANAVWMILYDLDTARADEYLHWFHQVHIPEKLARPGYTWAAHYRALKANEDSAATCVAMFGGSDSRVFYDPSPAQIKPRQTPETRAMMACRSNSRMLILAAEWVQAGSQSARQGDAAIDAERISLALCEANGCDEQFGAWLAQDYLPSRGQAGVTRKFLSSTGGVRHLLLQEWAADEAAAESIVERSADDWAATAPGYLSFPAGRPFAARRIWPVNE